MPFDPADLRDAVFTGPDYSWTEDDLILYHLGIGAGANPIDPVELRYVYESDLVALPSFGAVASFDTMMEFVTGRLQDVNLARLLHGEHSITVHRPIPTSGEVTNSGKITGLYDKGRGALLVMEIDSRESSSGEVLFTNIATLYLRGEGGFGGEAGPSTTIEMPDREPDHVVESPTLPQQSLLYRLSGDKNPLHADPAFAAFAGYERPILHGLCTYGVVTKAVVAASFGDDPTGLRSIGGRFSGVVFPGETVVSSVWDEDDRVYVSAVVKERDVPVITCGVVERAGV